MIGRFGQARVYAYCEPSDMRKGFDGLCGLVREALGKDPLSGSVFLFSNRRRTHAKLLWFDGSGLCVLAKRLERGRFAPLWEHCANTTLSLKKSELDLYLEGLQLIGRCQVSPAPLSNSDLEIRDRT